MLNILFFNKEYSENSLYYFYKKRFSFYNKEWFFSTERTVITVPPSSMDVTVGESIVLPCQVSHDPSIEVVFAWSFNGDVIDFKRGVHHFERIGGVSSSNCLAFNQSLSDMNIFHNSSSGFGMHGKSLSLSESCIHLFCFLIFHKDAWVICEAIIKMSKWKKLMMAMNILILKLHFLLIFSKL